MVFGEQDMEWIDAALVLCRDELWFNRQIREILRESIRERRKSSEKTGVPSLPRKMSFV